MTASGWPVHHRAALRWAAPGWCSCGFVSGNPVHSGCYTPTTPSTSTSRRSLWQQRSAISTWIHTNNILFSFYWNFSSFLLVHILLLKIDCRKASATTLEMCLRLFSCEKTDQESFCLPCLPRTDWYTEIALHTVWHNAPLRISLACSLPLMLCISFYLCHFLIFRFVSLCFVSALCICNCVCKPQIGP